MNNDLSAISESRIARTLIQVPIYRSQYFEKKKLLLKNFVWAIPDFLQFFLLPPTILPICHYPAYPPLSCLSATILPIRQYISTSGQYIVTKTFLIRAIGKFIIYQNSGHYATFLSAPACQCTNDSTLNCTQNALLFV